MAKPRKPGGPKQKLSPKAAAAKKARDERIAETPRRTAMKAENQRLRRKAIKEGKNIKGKDYDHATGSFEPVHANRGNFGKGTKKESPMDKDKKKKTISGQEAPKKRTWSEMTKRAKESGWKPSKPEKTRKSLKEIKALSDKAASKNSPINRKVGGHAGSIEGAKNNMMPGKTKWSPLDRMSPMKKYIGFDKLSKEIQGEGKSKESADAIAASIGRKKYGKAGMAKKAAAGRKG